MTRLLDYSKSYSKHDREVPTVAERLADLFAEQQHADFDPLGMLAVAVFVGDGRRVRIIRMFFPNLSILLRLFSETPHIARERPNPLNSAMKSAEGSGDQRSILS